MACCKNGCERRKEALLDAAVFTTAAEQGAFLISKLLEAAKAGGQLLNVFDNPTLNELVTTAGLLAAENQRLKKRLESAVAPAVTGTTTAVTFVFGPAGQYTLTVPVGDAQHKRKLLQQLLAAAAALTEGQPLTLPEQQVFKFVEAE